MLAPTTMMDKQSVWPYRSLPGPRCTSMRSRHERQQGCCTLYKSMRRTAHPKGQIACPTGHNAAAGAQDQFLYLARAIAKYNATIRTRFPVSDRFLQEIEACLFGVFWGLPLQLLIFLDAVETECALTAEQHDAFAHQLKQALAAETACLEKPQRTKEGEIAWKKSLPFATRGLPDAIEHQARAFFDSVYSLGVDRAPLLSHEKAFWQKHRRLRQLQRRAKRDREDLYRVLILLGRILPSALCGTVLLMVV
jgi:hypothetical protein